MRKLIIISVMALSALGLNAQTSSKAKNINIETKNAKTNDFSLIETGRGFWIQSSMNYGKNPGGCWDVPGNPTNIEKGSNIQVWDIDDGKDRIFYLNETLEPGVYEILIGDRNSFRCIDIAGGKPNMNKNAANIAIWSKNYGDWQKFKFKHLGNGKFKIYTTSGMAICLGRDNSNGANVHIWEDHNGDWMTWQLLDAKTHEVYIPETNSKTPDFFTKNTVTYMQNGGTYSYKGKVENVNVSGEEITLTINGQYDHYQANEDHTMIIKLNYRDGIYYSSYETEDGPRLEQGCVKTDDDGIVYLHAANGYFRIVEPEYPALFKNNKDKTFNYDESLAFVEGGKGTAKVKEVTNEKVILSVTSTKRNQSNGQMETTTFDLEIKYKDGKYFRGSMDTYYEEGETGKDSNGKEFLRLNGEQSSVTFKLQ